MWACRYLIVIFLTVASLSQPASADPNAVITLQNALGLTLMHHPELKAFSLEIQIAQARQLQAGLGPNPRLKFEVEEVGGGGERSGFDSAETSIVLFQPIEMGGKAAKREKVASLEKELVGFDYDQKKLDVFSDVTQAFVGVLKAQEKLALSEELLSLAESMFDTVGKRVDAGKDSPVEKRRASVSLAKIKIEHRKAQRNLVFSRENLASFWGRDATLFKSVAGQLDRLEALPSLMDLMDRLQKTPGAIRWEAEVRRSQAVLDLETAKEHGDITLGGGVQMFNETDDSTVKFIVIVPLPLSNRNQGAKQAAVHGLAKSHELRRAAWLRLQNDFRRVYRDFADAHGQAVSLKNEVLPAAEAMYDAAKRAYREGKVDYLNMLDAQRTLFEVKDEMIESLAAYHVGQSEIERFIGQ